MSSDVKHAYVCRGFARINITDGNRCTAVIAMGPRIVSPLVICRSSSDLLFRAHPMRAPLPQNRSTICHLDRPSGSVYALRVPASGSLDARRQTHVRRL